MTFVSWINGQEEYCLSSAQILTSKYQSIVDNRMKIECASNVVNVMEYSASRCAGSGKGIAEREGGPPAGCRSGSTGAGRATRGQHERICRPLRFHVSRVILECSL